MFANRNENNSGTGGLLRWSLSQVLTTIYDERLKQAVFVE